MNDYDPQSLQIILDESLVAIQSGRESIDSILAKYPHLADELQPDLEAALWLKAQRPSLEPRPGFITASRARLIAEIKQDASTAVVGRRAPFIARLTQVVQRKYALQFALIFILFIGFFSTGVVFVEAANRSIPGDPLYTTKLAIEEARLSLTSNPVRHINLEIRYAERRSEELQQLVLEERYEYIPQTTARFDALVEEVESEIDLLASSQPEEALVLTTSLQETVENQIVMLTFLAETAPPRAKADLLAASQMTRAYSISINELLQKVIRSLPPTTPTLSVQASNTPLPTITPSLLLLTATATPTPSLTPTVSLTPTPTVTGQSILPQPTSTATSVDQTEPREPTDTSVPPTDDEGPTPTDKPPNTHKPSTHTPKPDTPTPEPGDPTDIPDNNPTQPPDPTDIPGYGGEDPPPSTPKPTKTPKP